MSTFFIFSVVKRLTYILHLKHYPPGVGVFCFLVMVQAV
nr:MAG TPA: hypothetical protein [Caudoviricetes sp.]